MKDTKPKIAGYKPFVMECKPGRYSWCSCGYSKNQPFCDNEHRVKSELRSVKIDVEADTVIAFCMCKQTKNPPYCDGSHKACITED